MAQWRVFTQDTDLPFQTTAQKRAPN
jgi:hypothetical protein